MNHKECLLLAMSALVVILLVHLCVRDEVFTKRKEFLSVWGKKLLEMGLNVGHSQPVCDYYLPIKQTNNKTEGLGLIQQ